MTLNDKEQPREMLVGYDRTLAPFSISRRQLARFIVGCPASNDYVRKAPLLAAYTRG
ncbi:hypothetical protein [uncultured Hymenobacter sp.]|uniref:hypothetical protein n=1 Tax=uncultured Hymenobacter sp. TaxID=170016 RepID=UPI0035CAD465